MRARRQPGADLTSDRPEAFDPVSMRSLIPRERTELAPGAVHVPDWLSLERQRELVAACREWARA